MKSVVILFIFLGVLLAHAQEKGTTYFINYQGVTTQTYPIRANGVLDIDSAEFYQNMVEIYSYDGERFNNFGKAMMIVGGFMAPVFAILTVCSYNNKSSTTHLSYFGLFASMGIFTLGIPIRLAGSANLDKAELYREKLTKYQQQQQHSMKLRAIPTINLTNNRFGGNLALEF